MNTATAPSSVSMTLTTASSLPGLTTVVAPTPAASMMSTQRPSATAATTTHEMAAKGRAKLLALVELTKPRLTSMVLVTVGAGFVLGARGASHPATLLLTILATGAVASGASAWNQLLERDRDRLMKRTARRPLPSGRVSPMEAAFFGSVLTLGGVLALAIGANVLAALTALLTFALYVALYTPLKTRTTLNTAIGAIPGALPPVIGWAAATGRLGIEAWALFLIVFLWQFPHFLAIAWIFREDYDRAGYVMLPKLDPTGSITGRQALLHALALIPVGLLPYSVGLAGPWYAIGATLLGLHYCRAAARFAANVCDPQARKLLWASFVYLPMVVVLLLINPLPA